MKQGYTRLQAALNTKTDKLLIDHFKRVREEYSTLKSDADVLRHILERDMHVSRTFGVAWDWRIVVKTPPWMDRIVNAVKMLDGQSVVVTVGDKQQENKVVINEGIFEE